MMAGASNYPSSVDTDLVLVRVTSPDQIAGPSDMNNKIDAIQSLEATVGASGYESVGPYAQFNTSLMAHCAYKGSRVRNVRMPYSSTTSLLDGFVSELPGAASLSGGASVDFAANVPYSTLVLPSGATNPAVKMSMSLSGSVNELYARLYVPAVQDAAGGLVFGLYNADETSSASLTFGSGGAVSVQVGGVNWTENGAFLAGYALEPGWRYVRVVVSGSGSKVMVGSDGLYWPFCVVLNDYSLAADHWLLGNRSGVLTTSQVNVGIDFVMSAAVAWS